MCKWACFGIFLVSGLWSSLGSWTYYLETLCKCGKRPILTAFEDMNILCLLMLLLCLIYSTITLKSSTAASTRVGVGTISQCWGEILPLSVWLDLKCLWNSTFSKVAKGEKKGKKKKERIVPKWSYYKIIAVYVLDFCFCFPSFSFFLNFISKS